jgi:UDP-glucuronate 4-epimerase
MLKKEKILVTGCAGFIGMHLCKRLLDEGCLVFGVDSLNDYYNPKLKLDRLEVLSKYDLFNFEKIDISKIEEIKKIFKIFKPDKVVNLAAQAGVRYSLENPHAYISSNIEGFLNILECCRYNDTKGLIYASSSSVYGSNTKKPFSVNDRVDNPISIYAATKKANELMAHSYSHLYGIHTTGLRFFTVYGPFGRPDMAMYIFSDKILKNENISVYNHGNMERDFTYIDDIVDGVVASLAKNYYCEIFNLGNNKIEKLSKMINLIEQSLDRKANIDYMDIQLGDVKSTFADIDYSTEKLGYIPKFSLEDGIAKFLKWFKEYKKAD